MSDGTIITLTSIPPRFGVLEPTLRSLLDQQRSARVELWIPDHYRRFPDWDGALPKVPEGVQIRRSAQDWGPATKVVPAILDALAAGDPQRDLLFCDDDSLYAPDWHTRFHALRQQRPTEALAAIGRHLPGLGRVPRRADRMPRMRRFPPRVTRPIIEAQHRDGAYTPVPLVEQSGYADLFGGWGGVMVRPAFFARPLRDGPGDCWPVDDVWLSGMLALHDTAIWVEAGILPPTRRGGKVGGRAALANMRVDGKDREALDQGCIDALKARHGIWSDADLGLTR